MIIWTLRRLPPAQWVAPTLQLPQLCWFHNLAIRPPPHDSPIVRGSRKSQKSGREFGDAIRSSLRTCTWGGRRQHRLGWAEAFIQARAHRFGAKTQTCTQNFRRGQHKSLSHHTMAQKTQEKGVLRSAIPRFQGPGMTQARAGWVQSTANDVRPVGCNYPKMQSPTSFPIEGGPATRWPGAQNRGGQNGKKPAEPSHWLICCHARRRSRE